jgi:hypothetical protein
MYGANEDRKWGDRERRRKNKNVGPADNLIFPVGGAHELPELYEI